jgi:hypothetical protein
MWKVGPVARTMTSLVGGTQGYGFSIQNARGAPMLSFTYPTEEEAERSRELVENAITNVTNIQ